jgi:hypothetical protein
MLLDPGISVGLDVSPERLALAEEHLVGIHLVVQILYTSRQLSVADTALYLSFKLTVYHVDHLLFDTFFISISLRYLSLVGPMMCECEFN